ncbi:MAG TPA: hypothetical protein VF461_04040 [Gemmatimonadaceae bacterium]
MRHIWHRLAMVVAIVVMGVPFTFAATFALMPLWTMIERRYGIESVGHSGPSDWCFWVVFGVYLCLAAVVWVRLRRSAHGS